MCKTKIATKIAFTNNCCFLFQMNDLVRDKFTTKDGQIPVWAEILAGGTVGTYTLNLSKKAAPEVIVTGKNMS